MPVLTAVGEFGNDKNRRDEIIADMEKRISPGREVFVGRSILEMGDGSVKRVDRGRTMLFQGFGERIMPSRPMPQYLPPPQAR